MTLLELWVRAPLARSLALALVHSLWEGVLIAAILAAALCVARPPRARYGAACAAMLLMLASFTVTLAFLMPKPIELARTHAPVLMPAAPAALPVIPGETPPAPSVLAAFLPWIAPFWAAGVMVFHLRALGGWMAARRLRLSGVCRAPGEWQQRLDGLAARLRVSKPAALLESCLADAPVVMGYARPVILMPVGLLAGLPVAQVEAILLHELAHIRRQDYLVNLMQTFMEGLLFYHPAVWWISGVMRAERENCCDDLAVAATGDARQYAAALTALEQNRWAAHELALAATGGSLVKRIRRLLQQPERPSAAWTPIFSAGVLAVSAGIALAGWQAQPPQKAQPRVPAVLPAPPAAPVAVELPAAPVRKRAPQLLAQAQQSVEEQLKSQLQREGTANQQPTPYKKWLNEDVAYIITDQERAAYKALATDEEREQFITQFWQIRDPTPGTAENEFKDEHYRRIAYANMAFSSSVPGWKTDRGRIYITYGPPDELEDHSAGGATSTVPFQRWRYRFIEGTGTNVIIEFVDSDKTGEFRMTTGTRIFQFQSAGNPPASANIFTSVGDGPKVTLSVTSAKVNTQVSLALPSGSGKTDIIARITGANNQTVANLRDFTVAGQLNYKSGFRITPGSYTLTLVTRDQTSGAMQTSTVNFYVN